MSASSPASTDIQDLAARVRELEAENARLTAPTVNSTARPSGGRWRAIVSALVIVIAAILVPVSIVGAWARVQLVDEDAFVSTMAPLANDPDVQELVHDETMNAITAKVDFDQLTANVFDGIADLGLPPRATQALELLQAPAADGLENLVSQTLMRVVASESFADVWATTARAAHRALVASATSDGRGLVVRTDDGVGIQLGTVVGLLKQNLVDRGIRVADLIPEVDRVVIIGEGQNLAAIRTSYAIASTLGWWLPFLTLGLFGLGLLIARRRSTAILGIGLAFAIGSGALAASLAIGNTAVGIAAGEMDLSPSALDVIYGQLTADMAQTALVLSLFGVLVAVIGWLLGGTRPARSVRTATEGLNSSARTQLAARGLDTGAFGAWLGRHRAFVRTAIATLAVLWLFAMRPLSIGEIVTVLIVSLVVGWILELLQKRDDESVEERVKTDGTDTLVFDDAAAAESTVDADTLVLADADTLVIEGAAPKSKPKAKP